MFSRKIKFFIRGLQVHSIYNPLTSRNSAAIYDAPSDTWTTAASTKYGRHGTSLVTLMGRIFALGGLGYDNTAVVEEYIPSSNTWYLCNFQ